MSHCYFQVQFLLVETIQKAESSVIEEFLTAAGNYIFDVRKLLQLTFFADSS
jgi:hypothetical protein